MDIQRLLDKAKDHHWYIGSLAAILGMVFFISRNHVPREVIWILLVIAPFAAFGFSKYMKYLGRYL